MGGFFYCEAMKTFEFAADLETPVSAFLKLAPLEPLFLLESVERNEAVGRYSFLGIRPHKYLVLDETGNAAEFFASLSDCLAGLPADNAARFNSGLVGFFSYHIAALLHPKLKMRRSEYPLAGFVLPCAVLAFDHLKRRITLSSILPEVEQEMLAREVGACLRSAVVPPRYGKSAQPRPNVGKSDFYGMVERAKEHIAAGDIFQVVLSTQFEGETDADPFQMYRALRMINPSPYMFYLDFGKQFQFLGSSPETMVRTERIGDNAMRVVLRPIAGTRRRDPDVREDERLETELLKDEKEKAEHLMLVDLSRNDLGRLADPGTIVVPEFMKVERYSHVMHLVSTVQSSTHKNPSLRDLFAAVFPAGTVSGAPKVRAMQIIDELEPHARGLYAGSLGYMSGAGEVDHCISIRCLVQKQGKYQFTAGAGIVADSVAEREHDEIDRKAMALRSMLKMSEEAL